MWTCSTASFCAHKLQFIADISISIYIQFNLMVSHHSTINNTHILCFPLFSFCFLFLMTSMHTNEGLGKWGFVRLHLTFFPNFHLLMTKWECGGRTLAHYGFTAGERSKVVAFKDLPTPAWGAVSVTVPPQDGRMYNKYNKHAPCYNIVE